SALTSAYTFDVCAIFTRVVIEGSVPAGMSNTAASIFGFFSIRIAIASVFGMALATPIGTTAPFSAISGVEKKVTSLLCAGAPPPNAFIASSIVLASKAAVFHAAAGATPAVNQTAAV